MVINAHINQADVARLKMSQEVKAEVEAVPGLSVTGRVERIAPQATIKNNIKGFAVRIFLKDVDRRIRPGMTANIEIPVSAAEGVVAVPLAAVFSEPNPETQQNERFCYVKNGSGIERRPVQIGIADYFYAEVQKGLSPGEVVMLELPKDAKIINPPAPVVSKSTATTPSQKVAQSSSASKPVISGANRSAGGT
jgi:hypothetical protein